MKLQLALLILFVSCVDNSHIVSDDQNWLHKVLKDNQDEITDAIRKITIKIEDAREKLKSETVEGTCGPVNDNIEDPYDPSVLVGKWYAPLRSNDIFQKGKEEKVVANIGCVTYDIKEAGTGKFEVTETSHSGADTTAVPSTLTKMNGGKANYKMEGSDEGYDFAQVTAYKKDNYIVWYYCRNNGNGTKTIKMNMMSKTQKLSTSAILDFHMIVIFKNLKILSSEMGGHPRLFPIKYDTCPKVEGLGDELPKD